MDEAKVFRRVRWNLRQLPRLVVAPVAYLAVPIGLFGRLVTGPEVAEHVWVGVFLLLIGALAVGIAGALRTAVLLSPSQIRVVNLFRTHRVDWDDVAAVHPKIVAGLPAPVLALESRGGGRTVALFATPVILLPEFAAAVRTVGGESGLRFLDLTEAIYDDGSC